MCHSCHLKLIFRGCKLKLHLFGGTNNFLVLGKIVNPSQWGLMSEKGRIQLAPCTIYQNLSSILYPPMCSHKIKQKLDQFLLKNLNLMRPPTDEFCHLIGHLTTISMFYILNGDLILSNSSFSNVEVKNVLQIINQLEETYGSILIL